MNDITSIITDKILSYGISGFAFVLVVLTYFMMRSEFHREAPRKIVIKTIWFFMGLVLFSTVMVGLFSVPVASNNSKLRGEVDTMTVDMAQLTELTENYESAINELAAMLEKKSGTGDSDIGENPKKPDRDKIDQYALNKDLINKYITLDKLTVPDREYILNDSTRTAIKKAARHKLDTRNLSLNNR
ncbi:hypothetical protein LS482_20535 [Sinomicrobium kalidii]|uniref:hypothetical protein n=1 Tax=Sinomicrobium kalidii TaxID=2900738 RepID=UPI001E2B1064|nr:hypothetical protein [Sinomicrobium kalidii]UGU16051.1 hypothetical protein LS482_20535 [Sinomicrobium kalidii]